MKVETRGNDLVLTVDDFSISQTLECGQAFRFSSDDGVRYRGVAGRHILDCEQEGNRIVFYGMSKNDFDVFWRSYFDFDTDYAAVRRILSGDETLKSASDYAGGIRILRQDGWETICSFIFSQNNNIPRIKGIIERFCSCFGEQLDEDIFGFPSAETVEKLTVDDLAPVRSGFRAKYVIDAARKVASKEIDFDFLHTAPLELAMQMLMKISGVGPKVAQCALLFGFHRIDAFPEDVWIKRVMAEYYPNGLPEFVKPYAGIAQQFLFHYIRTGQKINNH